MKSKPTAVLFVSCPDQRGLVARISDFVYRHNGNIVDSDHHTDAESELFLMRVEWDLDGMAIGREQVAEVFAPLADSLKMRWEIHFSDRPQRIAAHMTTEELVSLWGKGRTVALLTPRMPPFPY